MVMTAYWGILLFLAGLIFGSFFNVLSDRLPEKQSSVKPPSSCHSCGRKLKAKDLVPVISYLILRGRCRYCSCSIPIRILLLELTTGVMFLLLYLNFGLTIELGVALLYFSALLLILIIDLEKKLILNVIIYPVAVIALVINLLLPGIEIVPGITSALAGGGVGLALFLLIALLSRGGMGMGDVKMAGLMGLMLGLPLNLVAIFLAVISGGIVAVAVMIIKEKSRRNPIAFGPFLAIGTMTAFIWGQELLEWYLGFFGF